MIKQTFLSDFGEYESDGYKVTFNAISVKGVRHQRNNEYNQDYFRCNVKNQIKYIILADGLGSAKHSHIGSQKAVDLLEQMINEHFCSEDTLLEKEINAFNSRFLENWRRIFPNNFREYDTTLLYLIIFKHGVLLGRIGDGLILYSVKNEAVQINEERNSFSNQTYSLASNNALDYFKSKYTPINFMQEVPIVFILTSDGVSDDLKHDMLKKLPAYLYDELREKGVIEMQRVIEDWIINWKTKNHSDDRTFCILTMWK
ncbi:PP2C family serine/threonine-protein phosphatase [Ectobacillus sp. sgz5001026]|uniref:PP2C family serine/threonine-protein phosphatase n=1 Tax=Ectobacillus sp. sgz5001026 TaxID=3242473 RepID=UPI0036D28109